MFVLNPNDKDKTKTEPTDKRSGTTGHGYQLSDDGQSAIVEFVATDRPAFKEIQESPLSEVKKFHKGREKREDLDRELKLYKKDFDLGPKTSRVKGLR